MIYLDYAATTRCSAEVIDAMLPFFRENFANASSIDHILGSKAREAVENARASIATLVGSQPEDVIFTSGSTEANNLALSVALPLVTTRVEHPSVLDVVLARSNSADRFVEIDRNGRVLEDALSRILAEGRHLVSVIATNNETGVEQDLDTLAALVSTTTSLLHVDATQAVGTRTIDLRKRKIAACSVSAHKIHGPKGIGALVISGEIRRELRPIQRGGGHERGLRSGTLNVPGIVGFAVAADLAARNRAARRQHLEQLRQRFIEAISAIRSSVVFTIQDAPTSPHILSLRLSGTNGRALLRAVKDEVAFSLGSACATNKAEPSHVLTALGIEKKAISETIRLSFSSEQSFDEIEKAASIIAHAANALAGYSLSA
jgi:cysteine desulfurase